MKFDGPTLAHAWLAVAQASGQDKDLPWLYKTVAIETYPEGIRLVATDRFILLTAWVPELGYHDTAEPATIEDAPDRVVVSADPDGRAKSLLGYVLSLAGRIDPDFYVPGQVDVDLVFDATLLEDRGDVSFAGMEQTYTVLDVPDTERVYLPIIGGANIAGDGWRNITHAHMPVSTSEIGLNPELVERIGKVRKHAAGVVTFTFGGADKAALIDWPESDPNVSGVVMPRKLEKDEDSPEFPASVSTETPGVTTFTFTSADAERLGKIADRLKEGATT